VLVDGLTGLLDGPRARGAFLLRCLMDPPWSVRLEDEVPLSVTAVVRGQAWAVPDGGEPFEVGAGDLLVSVGTEHWTIADSPSSPVNIVIHPGQHCTTPDGRPLAEEMHQGVRSWGNSASGATVILTGAYGMEGEVSRRLLRSLPRFVVLTEEQLDSPLIPLLADEIIKDSPGQDAVLDRLRGRRRTRPRGTSASPTPSSVPPSGCSSTTPSTAGRSRSSPLRAASLARPSLVASPTWSGSLRCSS
jgi:hypothetical protein